MTTEENQSPKLTQVYAFIFPIFSVLGPCQIVLGAALLVYGGLVGSWHAVAAGVVLGWLGHRGVRGMFGMSAQAQQSQSALSLLLSRAAKGDVQ